MAYERITSKLRIMDGKTMSITSNFGYRVDPITGKANAGHKGIDLVLWLGWNALSYIRAAAAGVVVEAHDLENTGDSRGNWVKIEHSNGITTQYFHLKDGSVTVRKGKRVSEGDIIGYMGSTGRSTGAHLHFQIEVNGVPVDPIPYIVGEKPIYGLYEREDRVEEAPAVGGDDGGNTPAAWAKSAVEWAVSEGLLVGDENGDLRLHDNMTRQQFCVLARRLYDMILHEV